MSDMPRDPDDEERAGVERQGNVMFWITLVCGVLILIVALLYAVVL